MENLARYIIRASFSQERMKYMEQEAKVVCTSKACPGPRSGDGKSTKVFDAPRIKYGAGSRMAVRHVLAHLEQG
jgi:hypothetical protein